MDPRITYSIIAFVALAIFLIVMDTRGARKGMDKH